MKMFGDLEVKIVEEDDEIDEKEEKESESLIFIDTDLTHEEIGQKIKAFAKLFHKLRKILCIIAVIVSIIYMFMGGGFNAIIFLIIIGISYVVSNFIFLIESGFGALVEDVNSIKNKK